MEFTINGDIDWDGEYGDTRSPGSLHTGFLDTGYMSPN